MIKSEAIKLGQVDKMILRILQADGNITNVRLSEEIGLSPAPTLESVKKLESLGVITAYHAKLDTDALGFVFSAFVLITIKGYKKRDFELFKSNIKEIEEVVECHEITGGLSDFILKVLTKDITSYRKLFLERIGEIEQVEDIQTMIVLSTAKDSKEIPI